MGDSELKEVNFNKYCFLCIYGTRKEKLEPCCSCLEIGMREGTEKPEYYEERK